AVVGTGAALYFSYANAVREAEVALTGLGRATGMTTGELMANADASADAANISVSAARRQQAEYIRMGVTNSGVLAELIDLTRDYALVTGQDAEGASRELGRAFADLTTGTETLNDRLNLFDATTQAHILSLIEQNRQTDAQTVAAEALRQKLGDVADQTNILARAWRNVQNAASDAWNAMGRGVNVRLGGGTTEDQLAAARASERSLVGRANDWFARQFGAPGPFQQHREQLEAQLAAEQAQARANAAAEERNRISREGAAAAAALMPWERQRAELSGQIADIERARAAGTMDEVTATRALTVARRRMA